MLTLTNSTLKALVNSKERAEMIHKEIENRLGSLVTYKTTQITPLDHSDLIKKVSTKIIVA